MPESNANHLPNFEQAVLPHLDAAYNLARWLTRNQQAAAQPLLHLFYPVLYLRGILVGGLRKDGAIQRKDKQA